MPRRFRPNVPLLTGFLLVFCGFALFVAWPLLLSYFTAMDAESGIPLPSTREIIRQRGITAITGLWFFVFGATIGSFLNVVAYRMPMGLTIVSKPSRCPYCETPIQFKHNMPIFGWLALRGRCSACRLPIAIRYPAVEVITGSLFFILVWRELISGGANLPDFAVKPRSGIMWNILSPNWPLIGIYFFHAFLISLLATIALIKFDRLRIPQKLGWFAILIACVCRTIWPNLTIVSWCSPSNSPIVLGGIGGRLIDPITGVVVGALVGWATHQIVETNPWSASRSSRSGILVVCSIVGASLGWQVVVPFLVIASLVQFFMMLLARLLVRPSGSMWATSCLIATLLVICLWKQLPVLGMPGPDSQITVHAGWLFIGLITAFVATRFST